MYRITDKYYNIELEESCTLLLSEDGGAILNSNLAISLLNKISTATQTKEELFRGYSSFVEIQAGLLTLHQLESSGYITTDSVFFPREQSAYWESLGYDVSKLGKALQSNSIKIKSISKLDISGIQNMCEVTGIKFSETPCLTVVIADDYLQPELEEINKTARSTNTPWLLVKLNGTVPLIGPLFSPNNKKSACWKCLEHRVLLHDQENRLYKAIKKRRHH